MSEESWRLCFRKGIAPALSTAGLEALRTALLTDDPRLLRGTTTTPPPLMCCADWPCEAACPFGYDYLATHEGATVGEVEEHFARVCYQCGQALGEPTGCRWFLNAWDEGEPEAIDNADLVAEIDRALALRVSGAA